MKRYCDLTLEEKETLHEVNIEFFQEELDSLHEDYDRETNIGTRYEMLIKIDFVRNLKSCEVDFLRNVRNALKKEN